MQPKKRRKVRATTCFLMGVVAGALYTIAGVLTLLGLGAAELLHIAAFAFTGAMVLFLATTERGKAGKNRRLKLLGLFLLLLVSYPYLPPLSTLAGALVLPLLAAMYLGSGARPLLYSLGAAELAYLVMEMVAIVNTSLVPFVAGGLAVLGLLRGFVALRMYQQEADKPADPGEDTRPV